MAVPVPGPGIADEGWAAELTEQCNDTASVVSGKPLFRARRAAAQSIGNGAETPVQWDTEDIDTHSGHDGVSNPSRWVVPRSGWYRVTGGVGFPSNATGRRGCFWRKNGTTLDASSAWWVTGVDGTHAIPARTMLVLCAAGDHLEMTVYQQSGGALNTATGTSSPSIDIIFERDV